MDCRTARLLLEFARPTVAELEPTEATALQSHLADCPDCAAVQHAERAADVPIGRAMRAVPIPDGLRDRLLARVNAERDVWYHRRVWKFMVPLAASIAVLIVGGLWLFQPRLTQVDLNRVHGTFNERLQAGDVTQGFRRMGVKTTAPPNFRYDLLNTYHLAELEGKQVPYMLFVRPDGATAHVYILDADHFDLDHLKQQRAVVSGQFHVQWLPNPSNPRIAYLVFYTGGALEPFLERQAGPLALASFRCIPIA